MRATSTLLAILILLSASALLGCGPSLPPINLSLERPEIPPTPRKDARVIKDPDTGELGFFVSSKDMASDLKWKAAAIGEIKKGQVNTDAANEAFRKFKKWVE